MKNTDFAGAAWRTSSRSNGQANCVEVAEAIDVVGVRDSKHRSGPVLSFPADAWRAFLTATRAGDHDTR